MPKMNDINYKLGLQKANTHTKYYENSHIKRPHLLTSQLFLYSSL